MLAFMVFRCTSIVTVHGVLEFKEYYRHKAYNVKTLQLLFYKINHMHLNCDDIDIMFCYALFCV